jgi:glutamate-1-semialdehyde 2,1-aminomutase
MFDAFFTGRPIANYRDLQAADMEKLKRFNRLLLERGVLKGDSKFYVSSAHDEADVALTLDAFAEAARALS